MVCTSKQWVHEAKEIYHMSKKTFFHLSRILIPVAIFLALESGIQAAKSSDAGIDDPAASIGNSLDGAKPSDPRVAWFREAKYGMFINWGLYSIPAGEWKGKSTGFAEFVISPWFFLSEWKLPASQPPSKRLGHQPTSTSSPEWKPIWLHASDRSRSSGPERNG